MEFLVLIGLLLFTGVIAGCIVAFVNLGSIVTLKSQVTNLKRSLADQSAEIKNLHVKLSHLTSSLQPDKQDDAQAPFQPTDTLANGQQNAPENNIQTPDDNAAHTQPTHPHAAMKKNVVSGSALKQKNTKPNRSFHFNLDTFLNSNGLLWIGATILSLGGIFLAKYSIEAGLIPPYLRILAGALFGVFLVATAEYLHQHPKRFQIKSQMVSGALASAGVITCYSMTLVAFDFYAYLSPLPAFLILAIISIGATWLAIRYGAILAAIGLVGAYVVPLFVATGSNNIFTLLSYVAFVSVSVVWVYHLVKKDWLWWMSLIAHFLWLFLAITKSNVNDIIPIIGFIFVSLYLYTVAPILGWRCHVRYSQSIPTKLLLMPRKEQLGILASIVCVIIFYIFHGFDNQIYAAVGALSLVLLIVPLRHSAFDTWPFLSLLLVIFILIIAPQPTDFINTAFPFSGVLLLVQIASLVFSVYGIIVLRMHPNRHSYLLFLALAPLSLYALSYALHPAKTHAYLFTVWGLQLIIYAFVFIVLAAKSQYTLHKASFLILTHGAVALILTMLLNAGTLTVALCFHIAIISIISHKYQLTLPNWILKIATAILLIRLTFAPWLDAYSTQNILGLHWSIVVYPLALICFYTAKRFQTPKLHSWLDGAMLHIVALFVTTQTSYYLQGQYLNLNTITWHESILLCMNWLLLGSVYLWRAQHTRLKTLYTWFAMALYAGAIMMFIYSSIFYNPFISQQDIGTHIIFNWLLPLWAIPSLILIFVLYFRLIETSLRRSLWIASAVFSTLYINAVIRFAYHEGISFLIYDVTQSELYTYSVVWLAIAAALIFTSQKTHNHNLNKIGFSVLAIVVLKAFLIDLSNLNGLYRALSFIGLGLSLVAIGWLFQRFQHKNLQ